MDYKNLIETNFGIEISNFTLLDSHFGTDIFLVETKSDRFMVKKLPDYMSGAKNEGKVTDYLSMNGIKVPRLLKLQNWECNLAIDDLQFTVQEFIEGHTLPLNQATDSFLKMQAELLGKINNALMNFEDLPLRFGREFFTKENAINKLNEYKQT